jgi:hypothetical protein
MALAPGTRLGPYAIGAQIGLGGMGEVYRARDTNLGRDVAIKVLPEAFAQDPERLARFEREAKTLASLNHPNIATIHGLERAGGVLAIVMELVEGPTLADRIAQGPIPVDEALPIAKQIAEALEAAHEQGIIHRDLKPANIKLRPDGTVKVLDFGLAKALDPARGAIDASQSSPTISSPAMTRMGVILGTAAYMSPEQAKGRPADKRSDVWAFGCLLYEMLTGKRAFEAEDASEALAAVLRGEPDWTALPADLSLSMRTLIKRCLDKDPTRRVADIVIARYVLDEPAVVASVASDSTRALPISGVSRTSAKRRIATHATAVLLASAVVGTAAWSVGRSSVLPPRVSRFVINYQGAAALSVNSVDRDLAITPDGSRIVYVGNLGTQLFVRPLAALEPVAIYKGELRAPFVSPDGQWVGFIQGNSTLQKVALSGGPAVTLARLDGVPRGATWMPDDTIVFATTNPTTGLQRVSADGGPPTVLTRPDRAQGEVDHVWPEMLPGGRAVLFTISAPTGGLDVAQVAVLDLQSGTRKVLVRGGTHAQYVSSGHLVYAAAGSLMAVGFDPTRLETRGTPVPVIPQLMTTLAGAVNAVVAGNRTLAYVSGGDVSLGRQTLVWLDRQGRETPTAAPPRGYLYPRIAPDSTRVAFYSPDQEFDIFLWDFTRKTARRVTSDPAPDVYPVWTPDGRHLIFASERAAGRNLFSQAADGSGIVERLTDGPNAKNPTAVTPDGRSLLFTETSPKTGEDVLQLQLDGTHRVTPLVQTPFRERAGVVSPDGRWLAYEANANGQFEIYVRPFPAVDGGVWQVSTVGGMSPSWARSGSGQELFYVERSGALMRVGVKRSETWMPSVPAKLPIDLQSPFGNYDVSPDGQRFLTTGPRQTSAPTIVVVQNWHEELQRLVPTK